MLHFVINISHGILLENILVHAGSRNLSPIHSFNVYLKFNIPYYNDFLFLLKWDNYIHSNIFSSILNQSLVEIISRRWNIKNRNITFSILKCLSYPGIVVDTIYRYSSIKLGPPTIQLSMSAQRDIQFTCRIKLQNA